MSAALWLDVGVAAAGLLALALLLNGGRHWRRGHRWRGCRHGFSALVLGLIAAFVLLIGLNLLTYSRLTAEVQVGEIGFVAQGPERYLATFARADGSTVTAELHGDEWQISARFIKWKGIGTLLGLPPLYRLQRLSGRYTSIADERHHYPTVVGLSVTRGLSFWQAVHGWASWLPLADASYGTATYLPMADGAQYVITASATGLLARPANEAARQAVRNWE